MAVREEVFFIVGCPRSGSTLLNRLLRDCVDIGFANELQLIPKYYLRQRLYGDLSLEANLNRLLADIMKEPYVSIFEKAYTKQLGWPVRLEQKKVKLWIPEPTLAGVVYGLLKETAVQLGKSRIGNKHLIMSLHMDWLNEMFPKCKVIHIVRDGRDCALSLFREHWGQKNVYAAARFWAASVALARRYGLKRMGGRYIEIRYEDFISRPEMEMKRIQNFVEGTSSDSSIPLHWKEHISSIKAANAYKWKRFMDAKDVTLFQGVAGDVLKQSGYELTDMNLRPSPWMAIFYILEDRVKRELAARFPGVRLFEARQRRSDRGKE